MSAMDENPYQAPRANPELPHQREPNPTRSIFWAVVCALLGLVWAMFCIALVVPTVEMVRGGQRIVWPSTAERVMWIFMGVIPGIWLFSWAIHLARR